MVVDHQLETRSEMEDRVRRDHRMSIGGQWSDASDGHRMEVIDPSTEERIGTVPKATAADVDRAVETGRIAQPEWGRTHWEQRAAALTALADRVAESAEELCRLDAIDGGLPVTPMARDVANGIRYLRYYASLASELKGETAAVPGEGIGFTLREPFGVVGRIVPFNHPFQFAAQAIGAPLAAGNAVVLKPADSTPLSALQLARLAEGILPPGLLSVLTGDGSTGQALISHPVVRRIGFTGSSRTAAQVMRAAADQIKTLSFELGGKNPMIVLPDADIDAAAAACVQAMNLARCQGQSCGSPSRVFVHSDIRRAFVDALATHAGQLRIGDALDESVDMGPLAFGAHFERVKGYIDTGTAEGARLVSGGVRPAGLERGFFLEPAVFDGVTSDMAIATEEIFGPVMAVLEWSRIDDVIAEINALDLGLTANIWTNDIGTAITLARAVQSGYVYINGRGQRPFGLPFGGYGISGLGKENDLSELLSYTQVKTVLLDFPADRVHGFDAAREGSDG